MTWTRRERLILLSPLAAVAVAFGPALDGGPTMCPFALATGMACPGCGMTRAASHLLHGDIGGAISYHPLILAFALLAVVGWGWFVLRKYGRVGPIRHRTLNAILIATAVALLAVWVARLATGSLPPV